MIKIVAAFRINVCVSGGISSNLVLLVLFSPSHHRLIHKRLLFRYNSNCKELFFFLPLNKKSIIPSATAIEIMHCSDSFTPPPSFASTRCISYFHALESIWSIICYKLDCFFHLPKFFHRKITSFIFCLLSRRQTASLNVFLSFCTLHINSIIFAWISCWPLLAVCFIHSNNEQQKAASDSIRQSEKKRKYITSFVLLDGPLNSIEW